MSVTEHFILITEFLSVQVAHAMHRFMFVSPIPFNWSGDCWVLTGGKIIHNL